MREGGEAAEGGELGVDGWAVLQEFPLPVAVADGIPHAPEHLRPNTTIKKGQRKCKGGAW